HLRERRVEFLDVPAEVLAVLEVELVLSGALDRHREVEALLLPGSRDVRAELLVHEEAGRVFGRAALDRLAEALVDHHLRVADPLGLLRRGLARDAEELLLDGPSVVEREDVERLVVPEAHVRAPFVLHEASFFGASLFHPGARAASGRPALDTAVSLHPGWGYAPRAGMSARTRGKPSGRARTGDHE